MKKRTMIERKCAECSEIKIVRKDGAGKCCSPCRARLNHKKAHPKKMEGEKFGRLKVESFAYIRKTAYWNCVCDCGVKCVIDGSKMRFGTTKSCGCIVSTQKGLSKSNSYNTWNSLVQRCHNPNWVNYKRYGGQGVTVCVRWKESFENFLLDMGERPIDKTLDRIDSKGDYCKENCRWATVKEQANNTKSNFMIECFGKTQSLTQWAEEYDLGWSTLRKRIVGLGWNIEKALTKKVGRYAAS